MSKYGVFVGPGVPPYRVLLKRDPSTGKIVMPPGVLPGNVYSRVTGVAPSRLPDGPPAAAGPADREDALLTFHQALAFVGEPDRNPKTGRQLDRRSKLWQAYNQEAIAYGLRSPALASLEDGRLVDARQVDEINLEGDIRRLEELVPGGPAEGGRRVAFGGGDGLTVESLDYRIRAQVIVSRVAGDAGRIQLVYKLLQGQVQAFLQELMRSQGRPASVLVDDLVHLGPRSLILAASWDGRPVALKVHLDAGRFVREQRLLRLLNRATRSVPELIHSGASVLVLERLELPASTPSWSAIRSTLRHLTVGCRVDQRQPQLRHLLARGDELVLVDWADGEVVRRGADARVHAWALGFLQTLPVGRLASSLAGWILDNSEDFPLSDDDEVWVQSKL